MDNARLMTASSPPALSTTPSAARPAPLPRSRFAQFRAIGTRWSDNDIYGHVNNVTYYSWFDTAVNAALIEAGLLDIHAGAVIGLVVHSECHYFAPLAFPQTVQAGVGVEHIGRSSVTYRVGLFAEGAELCAAHGRFVHVYVDRESRRPVALTPAWLDTLQRWS
jgi:acyl-CoA thioester hydrolase